MTPGENSSWCTRIHLLLQNIINLKVFKNVFWKVLVAKGMHQRWNFCILAPFENNFYKKTYVKTFSENRPFLGILEHDAEVWGSASTDTTPRYCHITDDPGRRRHGGVWGPRRRRRVSKRQGPNLGAVGSHAELLACGPGGPTTLRSPIARRTIIWRRDANLGAARLNAEVRRSMHAARSVSFH
jgi:hypothetical protein